MKKQIVGLCLVMASLWVSAACASSVGQAISADEALQKLLEGNKQFADSKMTLSEHSGAANRAALAKTQKPYAIVLSCSDSRVPPEIIFDKGLGEIFVVRVAGNIPDPVILGSIEYAAEHLGSPLIMVLGHERCGAVTAAVTSKGKSTGSPNIDAIVKNINPSVKQAAKDCEACKGESKCADKKKDDFVECVVSDNAKYVAANLTKNSKILKHLSEEGKIKIVAAKYDLDDGVVSLLK
ncbi:MAG: carbonic anhydrase [Desulfuromonadales bacterium]